MRQSAFGISLDNCGPQKLLATKIWAMFSSTSQLGRRRIGRFARLGFGKPATP